MLEKKSSDFLWKIVLTGDSYVGKTTIRKRAMGEHFAEEYISTVGADFSSYKLRVGDLVIGFQVWDLAGQDKYKYIRSSFYGGATGCFLAYDVTNPTSLKSLSNWVDEAIRYSNGTIEIFIICANKIDLKDKREISRESGENYTKALRESSGLQCAYIETSALTGENIDKAFDIMAKFLLEREGITPASKVAEPLPLKIKDESEKFIDAEKLTFPPKPQLFESEKPFILSQASKPEIKHKIIDDDTSDFTNDLISEVMAVLDETNDVIIGREITNEGERVITVPKNSLDEKKIKEEKPIITPELERVLQVINVKLDSLTGRMKELEDEISHVKLDTYVEESQKPITTIKQDSSKRQYHLNENFTEAKDEVYAESFEELTKTEVRDEERNDFIDEELKEEEDDKLEFEADAFEETERETTEQMLNEFDKLEKDDEQLNKDQKFLEALLHLNEEPEENDDPKGKVEPTEDFEKQNEELEELYDLPDNDLIDIPETNSIEPLKEEHTPVSESIIGTELTSAMISELKDLSEEPKTETNKVPIQPAITEKVVTNTVCSICGQQTKYIRQYNKYYCVKCGRYII